LVSILDPDQSVFTVTGQIEHKLSFINRFVPDDVKIVLIGHSIGAHVVLEMLDILPSERVLEGECKACNVAVLVLFSCYPCTLYIEREHRLNVVLLNICYK